MEEILSFAPPIVSRVERSWNGALACRTTRAAHGRHEFRMKQSRHVIALQLSPAPITSADRLGDRTWPQRTRAVCSRINIVPAGAEWVSQTEAQARSEYVALFVPDRFIDALDDGASLKQAIRPALDAELPGVRRVMQALADDLREPVYGNLFFDGALRLLLCELGRSGLGRRPRESSRALLTSRQLVRLDEVLEAHLHEPLTVHDLARTLGVSDAVLARGTRHAFGITPYQLVLERRIRRAQALLTQSPSPLSWIGARCGFDDQAHFTTAFRKWVGVSPGRYRREHL